MQVSGVGENGGGKMETTILAQQQKKEEEETPVHSLVVAVTRPAIYLGWAVSRKCYPVILSPKPPEIFW